ncbi:hypothetical protein I5F10_12355 [Proteus mirabilis]|nr:hypothetical protein [Proteus mirabilis]MBG6048973.1 hypothetical protein [Proteus mirabilis]
MEVFVEEVRNAGDIEKECVVLKCYGNDVGWPEGYIVFDQTYDADGNESNKIRHLYIFPDKTKGEGDDVPTYYRWAYGDIIELYTRNGRNRIVKDGTQTVFKYFWKLGNSVWNSNGDKVTIIKIEDKSEFTI